jgi:hypothetical protein
MMNQQHQDEFWRLYEQRARQAIENACQRASRSLSENTMDVFDMVAWCDDRVWRMMRLDQAPTFHDDPSPEQAIERIVNNARTLARWAYLALSRQHWRRMQRSRDVVAAMSRTERLASTKAADVDLEMREEIAAKLASVREAVSDKVRRRAAASWNEISERQRIAEALGTTDDEGQAMLDKTMNGEVKTNTIEQMRSRALRKMRTVMAESANAAKALLIVGVAVLALGATSQAFAGEQSGGRRGGAVAQQDLFAMPAAVQCKSGGEQSGGRGGG